MDELTDEQYDKLKELSYEIALSCLSNGMDVYKTKGLMLTAMEVGIYEADVCCVLGN